jgi:hypothetical protein
MRQFEGFTDKIAVPAFTRDTNYHTVTLTGIPDDAQLLTIEIFTQTSANVGVRPTGTANPDVIFDQNSTPAVNQTTTIMHVNSSKQMDFKSNQADSVFSITGAWGGTGVRSFGPTFPTAAGWTDVNSEAWREYDLDTLSTTFLPTVDRGNIEAVICHLRPNNGSKADVRGNGSTWERGDTFPGVNRKLDSIVAVDPDDVLEVFEGDNGQKIKFQNSFVHFVGYILKGAYVNHDDGKFYRYKAILNPTDDGVSVPSEGDWDSFNIAANTVSRNLVGVYWRIQYVGTNNNVVQYAREVGSTDTALQQAKSHYLIPGSVLNVGEDGEVEFTMRAANTFSWIFGYLEEAFPRSQTRIMKV